MLRGASLLGRGAGMAVPMTAGMHLLGLGREEDSEDGRPAPSRREAHAWAGWVGTRAIVVKIESIDSIGWLIDRRADPPIRD